LTIEKGNLRFLYIKALGELQKAGNFNINEISDESILERYLNVLECKYGKGKHYEKIKRLLLITALLDEPATIEELSYLYSFDPADFKFIGYLTDLQGLLRIDRTGTDETISASVGAIHEDWKQYLINNYEDMVQDIIICWKSEINEKVKKYRNKDTSVLDNITDGERYLVANFYYLLKAYHPDAIGFFSDEDVRNFMSDFANKIAGIIPDTNTTRAEKIYSGIISHIEDQTESFDEDKMALLYLQRGLLRYDLLLCENAGADCNRYIEFIEHLRSEGKTYDENILAKAYMIRGVAYMTKEENCKAMDDYGRCCEIMERLRNEDKPYDINNLVLASLNMENMYHSMKHDIAMADHDRYIKIMECLYSDSCIKLMEYLYREGSSSSYFKFDENDLVKAYMNRGDTYCSKMEYGKAIEDYDGSIEIMEQLQVDGKLLNENALTEAYAKRKAALDAMQG